MNIRKLTAAGVAVACLAAMAGCGGNTASSTADGNKTGITYPEITLGETGTDLNTEITFMNARTDMNLDTYPGKNWKAYLEDFNKMYPGIKVTVQTDSNYADSSLTRLQGNNDSWDIMCIPAVDKSEFKNYFVPLGEQSEMDKLIRLTNAQTSEGQTYGIALGATVSGIVYNKRIFEEAGVKEVPKTPEAYLAALKLVKDNTDAIPLYTNFAAEWAMGAWDAYIGGNATGDTNFMNAMAHDKTPFAKNADDEQAHPYAVYKTLYDAVANGLTEEDYSTTDWESSKGRINNGEIASMVLGAWAVPQMEQAGEHADDIGYMPFPITVDGKQYATMGPDYAMAVNKNISKERQEASMIFIKWMTEQSGYALAEGLIPMDLSNDDMPALYESFSDVEMITDDPAPEGEEDLFADVNSDSELGINSGNGKKVQDIVVQAATKGKSFDDIMDEWNQKWGAAVDGNA